MTETQQAEVGGNPADRTYEPGVDQLAAALAAVQAELPRIVAAEVAKVTGETKGGKPVSYSYKYAGLATVAGAILPLLGKHGLAFSSWPTLAGNRFVLRYELLHSSGQRLGGLYPLNEDVRSPQAMGSQITYARRYALCAVTGIAPDDDDDAAAAEAKVSAQRAAEQAEYDKEREDATQSVMGAWANQFGAWDGPAAAKMFETWSKGGAVDQASPKQLRAFTGYLLALPVADAGSTPNTEQPPADDGVREVDTDRPLSRKDNAHMFVLFEKLGMGKNDRQRQLEYLRDVLERDIQSRSDVRAADWGRLRVALEADVAEAQASGMAPTQPGDS